MAINLNVASMANVAVKNYFQMIIDDNHFQCKANNFYRMIT